MIEAENRAAAKAAGWEPDDDMGDRQTILGDMVQVHQAPQQRSGISTLGKLAIGAGLVASGAGIAAGIPLLIDVLKPDPTPAQPAVVSPVVVPVERPPSKPPAFNPNEYEFGFGTGQ